MSRFKFRMWNPLTKRMCKRIKGGIKGLSSHIVMQSTGLLDQDENLIFEEDIISFDYKDEEGQTVSTCGYVTWLQSQAAFTVVTHRGQYVLSPYFENIKVLGNMYQNSEIYRGPSDIEEAVFEEVTEDEVKQDSDSEE